MLGDAIYILADLASLSRDNFRVDTTCESVGKSYDKCLVMKSLCTDSGALSPITNRLTIEYLK